MNNAQSPQSYRERRASRSERNAPGREQHDARDLSPRESQHAPGGGPGITNDRGPVATGASDMTATTPAPVMSSDRTVSDASRLERIARRAHEIYEARGGEHGRNMDDWLQAEREIDEKDDHG